MRAELMECNSAALAMERYGTMFWNKPVFPNFDSRMSNKISKYVGEKLEWPTHDLADPPRPLRATLHGLRAAPATMAICMYNIPVEEVMVRGHWDSAAVADYVQGCVSTACVNSQWSP
jgi:hypothetical protein